MKHRVAFVVLALFGLSAACGGGQPEATQATNPAPSTAASASEAPSATAAVPSVTATGAPAPSAAAEAAGPPGPGDWDKWSHDQKLAYMKSAVMPKMNALFHEYDPLKYDAPKCVLCHGAGVADGTFKMPNPGLPKLDLSPAGFKKLHAKNAAMLDFMSKKVVPQMAQLLGEQPYDPATQQGFGCMECHTKVEGKMDAKTAPKGATKADKPDAKPASKSDAKP